MSFSIRNVTASMPSPPPCPNNNIHHHRRATFVYRLGMGALAIATGSSNTRLAIVMPWVKGAGEQLRIPPFFSFWVASAARNAGLADFLIFHGPGMRSLFFEKQPAMPPNIRFIEIADFVELYRNKIEVKVPFTTSIIKDLKPAIGHVYSEYLQQYTHWAFGDADVVYGDLRRFLTDDVINKHDVTTVISDHFCSKKYYTLWAGQLTVFKNNEWTRQLFRQVPKWQVIFSRPKAVFFDERNMPAHVLSTSPERVAFVWGQLSDHRGALRNSQIVWRDGRLLSLVANQCVASEAALVHLSNLNHNKRLTGDLFLDRPSADSREFRLELDGTRPWRWENLSTPALSCAE